VRVNRPENLAARLQARAAEATWETRHELGQAPAFDDTRLPSLVHFPERYSMITVIVLLDQKLSPSASNIRLDTTVNV
jgi:uncharacterized membrane protein (DUF2068 family)